MNEPLLEVTNLYKAFGRTEALRGLSMSLAHNEVVAVTGPSGSGKSTLLMCLAGIVRPEAGQVRYAGQDLNDLSEHDRTRLRRRELGIVLQFGQLVPELSAVHNVALPLLLEKHDQGSARTAALAWLDRLGAAELADALPGQLSGGEAQRVAIARALVTGPKILFADEPTGALDSVGGEQVLEAMLESAAATGAAVVLVTHDNRVAAHASREICLRDGRLVSASVLS